MPKPLNFDLPPASKEDENKIVKSLNVNKAREPDAIPLKLIKLSANVVDRYLTASWAMIFGDLISQMEQRAP